MYIYTHGEKKYIYEEKYTDTWEVYLLKKKKHLGGLSFKKKRHFCSVWRVSKTAVLGSHLNMENIAVSSVNMWETVEEPGQKW